MGSTANPPRTTSEKHNLGLRNRLSERVMPTPSQAVSELQRIVVERLDQTKRG